VAKHVKGDLLGALERLVRRLSGGESCEMYALRQIHFLTGACDSCAGRDALRNPDVSLTTLQEIRAISSQFVKPNNKLSNEK
jgi:hypothetical protein